MGYETISTRVERDLASRFKRLCEAKKVTPSSKINEFIKDELAQGWPATVAGKNVIEYDIETDSFTWLIRVDREKNIEVAKNLHIDFMQDLFETVAHAIETKNIQTNNEHGDSVGIPRKLVGGKK
jgi:hypothetical protein